MSVPIAFTLAMLYMKVPFSLEDYWGGAAKARRTNHTQHCGRCRAASTIVGITASAACRHVLFPFYALDD